MGDVVRAITAVVAGRVQGVGFRYAVIRTAEQLGIEGWVRNAADGSVEVFAQGEPQAVGQLEAFLHRGPRAAVVASIVVDEVPAEPGIHGFEARF